MAYRNLIGADNFFETASKEELIDFLIKKINSEVEKGDGADCDLIRECSDWLDELTQDEIVFTPEELERNLEKIKAKVMSDKPIKKRKKMSVKTFMRVALIAAVIFTISILSLSVVATNKEYDSTWEYVISNIEKIFGLNFSEKISDNGITIINNKTRNYYKNMDALLEGESLKILYPLSLPDNIKITQISIIYETEEKNTIVFSFSKNSYKLTVTNYYTTDVTKLNNYECHCTSNYNYYIIKKDENVFLAFIQYDGFEYSIQSPDYDYLLIMASNMKG